MMKAIYILIVVVLFGCNTKKVSEDVISVEVIDTDFSKGRLVHRQTIGLNDLEKFHGHLCDGLVLGALALKETMSHHYPDQSIDRTNLRIVSKSAPCLTDVAIFVTGARYQYNTIYVDNNISGLYIVQRIDNLKTFSVSLNKGVKPSIIDSLGNLASQQKLSACGIDSLRILEDQFTEKLFKSNTKQIFTIKELTDFVWLPNYSNTFIKTDVINKSKLNCGE